MNAVGYYVTVGVSLACVVGAGCGNGDVITAARDIETGFAFTNFSRKRYAALRIREHTSGAGATFFDTPLLPPGGTQRTQFLDALGVACPGSIDVRVLLYARINGDTPIGLDPGEQVEPTPEVAGSMDNLPVCEAQPVETLTIVNWDAPDGLALVKIAQGTPLESVFSERGLFLNTDRAWAFEGVAEPLTAMAPVPHAAVVPIRGRVVDLAGTGVGGMGVLLRTRFRIRLNDGNAANDPDAGFGEPIAFTTSDQDGAFSFDRPAGVYRVEVFSDDFLFRPVTVDVESPAGALVFIAEPR